jgi:glycosyltransferase involved in cell wall biosynthesis
VDAIHAAMRRLASDEPLREHLGAAALQRAQRFSWRETARAVLGVYASLTESYPRTSERKAIGARARSG